MTRSSSAFGRERLKTGTVRHLRSAYFEDLEEIGDAYKIESRKKNVKINRPFQVGIVVYQLAKLRMLQFYYDFLDHYVDRRDYELIQMDTDSMYFAGEKEMVGAKESPACSNLRRKEQGPSRCTASATS